MVNSKTSNYESQNDQTAITQIPNNRKRQSFETLQCGRGVAALAVVCFHANLTLGLPKYFGREPAYVFSSGFSGIYYFFVLSGAVMMIAHWNQIGGLQNPLDFYLKRFKRIYLPLWAALLFIIPALVARISMLDAFLAFSVLPAPRENILAVEWTLRHEILFYSIFGLFLWRPIWGGTILAFWFMSSLLSIFMQSSFPLDFITSPLHILFAMGMLGAMAVRREMRFPKTISVLGALIFSLAWIAQVDGIQLPSTAWPLIYGTGATFLIVGLARLEKMNALAIPRALKMLGDASYAIYLVHFPVVSLCAKLAASLINNPGGLLLALIFLIAIFLAVVSGLIFHALIERPAMRLRYPMAFLSSGIK